MLFFNHQLIWKHSRLNIHFIYNYCIFFILDYISKGFSTSEIIDSSLLNSPLLSWDGILDLKNALSKCCKYHMKSNPWYRQYITIYEQSNGFNSICILSSDIVDEIITYLYIYIWIWKYAWYWWNIKFINFIWFAFKFKIVHKQRFLYSREYDQKIIQKWSMSWKTYSLV
jgi:hypothetical protein